MVRTNFAWLNVSAEAAGKRLLGCELVSTVNQQTVQARIVETEAYDQTDEASHAFIGRTARNSTMFKSAGHMYVYLSYGVHYCCNIVCGKEGFGSGVLIRAVEPIVGVEIIENRRHKKDVQATNGPGKVCQALSIDYRLDGHELTRPPVRLIKKPPLPDSHIATSRRIGITKAAHELRRFYVVDNAYVSKSRENI